MLIVSKKDVERLMPAKDAIRVVGKAYSEIANRTAKVPERIRLDGNEKGVALLMPGYLSAGRDMAVKLVTVFPGNAEFNLPVIHGLVVVMDPDTGKPIAVIEGASLTAVRTGASCGLATDLLAGKSASTLAMIGAGAQSRQIVPAVCGVRAIERVLVFDTNQAAAMDLVSEISSTFESIACGSVESADAAVSEADIVCTATTSSKPVFDGNSLKSGVHINGIGSFTPEMQEVGLETIAKCSKIVVDSYDGAMAEAGDLLIAIKNGVLSRESIYGEIGDVVNGSLPGREDDSETTFFKSVGNAALDVAVAAEIYRLAISDGSGTIVEI